MPTPSSDTSTNQVQVAAAAEADSSDTLRFRAPTLEAAIALAETSLGTRVRVVAANRIRRGGIGGFFASDLGVEVTVALDDETMEQALERIVAESTVDDRVQFESRLAQQFGAASSPVATNPANPANPATTPAAPWVGRRFDQRDDQRNDEPVAAVNPVLSEVLAALMAEAAEQQMFQPDPAQAAPAMILAPSTAVDAGRRPVYATPPTMVRVEQIIEELSAITAQPVFGSDRARGRVGRPTVIDHPSAAGADRTDAGGDRGNAAAAVDVPRPKVLPTLPPRSGEIARAASAASAANHTRALASPSKLATIGRPPNDDADQTEMSRMERMAESVRRALEGDHDPGLVSTVDRSETNGSVHAVLEIDADALEQMAEDRDPERDRGIRSPRQGGSSSAPSRRQVELAVAATDQLIESLKRDEGVKRLSVRVVLRTGDQREVEAEAEWESAWSHPPGVDGADGRSRSGIR